MLGAVTGVMGTLQAAEVLKEILGIGDSLSGRLLVWDALGTRFQTIRLPRTRPARPAATIPPSTTCPPMPEPFGVLLLSGTHDRAHYAFVLATGAAALGRTSRCSRPTPGAARCWRIGGRWRERSATRVIAARGVAGLDTLREAAGELGIRLIACEAGLRAEAIDAAALLPGVDVAGVATFLEAVRGGQIVTC